MTSYSFNINILHMHESISNTFITKVIFFQHNYQGLHTLFMETS